MVDVEDLEEVAADSAEDKVLTEGDKEVLAVAEPEVVLAETGEDIAVEGTGADFPPEADPPMVDKETTAEDQAVPISRPQDS